MAIAAAVATLVCIAPAIAAALSSPWGPEAAFRAINVTATERLLDAAKAAGASGFIFVSSPSIYAALKDQVALTEQSPLPAHSLNAYAETKRIAEELVLAANAPAFRTVSVRPRALIGPDDKVLLPRIIALASRGWFPALRGGRALIELTDVRDAAAALVKADQHLVDASGQAFNISGGRPTSVAELVGKLGAALQRPITMRPVPVQLAPAQSSQTYGLRWQNEWEVGGYRPRLTLEVAQQREYGGNGADFDLGYRHAEFGLRRGSWSVIAGGEHLEGDDTRGFSTPLATLHAFQGWADVFLTTPPDGVRDLYAGISYSAFERRDFAIIVGAGDADDFVHIHRNKVVAALDEVAAERLRTFGGLWQRD